MVDWIAANVVLRGLWNTSKCPEDFIKASMKQYKWTERQCLQNTLFIFRENNVMAPSIEHKSISRKYKASE